MTQSPPLQAGGFLGQRRCEADGRPDRGRHRALALIAISQVLVLTVWFGLSAVAPALAGAWDLSTAGASWLTSAVQLGFVSGAVLSAVLNLADRVQCRTLIAGAATGAALANAGLVLFADGLAEAIALRFATGFFLAGVYPPAMKLLTSWFERGRGLAIGILVGALTLGSGTPQLFAGFEALDWQVVLGICSALAVVGAVVVVFVPNGPFAAPSPPLDMRYAVRSFRERPVRLANFGYFGHMWELYAVWAWLPVYIAASTDAGRSGGVLAFVAIGLAGFVGCAVAGFVADRIGRTVTTIVALTASGACCLLSAVAFGAPKGVVVALGLVWGFFVIADSAQFSAAVSELADRRYVGTALTVQVAVGFLLTVGSIRLVAALAGAWGWRWAFPVLALGPAFGAYSMWQLRRNPRSIRLAGGAR